MKFRWKGKEYYIDKALALALDSLIYNVRKDWDFIIIVTGDRNVRTGKSVIAMTVCAYLAYRMHLLKLKTTFDINSVYFDSKKMISDALNKPKCSVLLYDEGRAGLASSKFLTPVQQDLLDYFAECGQLNHIFVVVLPDFFGLTEEIAIARSELLINVYRKEVKLMVDMYKEGEKKPVVRFDRGQFEFFNRYKKQDLYDKAKLWRKKSYALVKADFLGKFTNQYTVDEKVYRAKKREYLKRFKERKELEGKRAKTDVFRDKEIMILFEDGKKTSEIKLILKKEYDYDITQRHVQRLIRKSISENAKKGGSVS